MTLLELLIVLAVLALLGVVGVQGSLHEREIRSRALRIQCLNNQKAIGTAFRVWADDHNGFYPMSLSQTNGGTAEFITGANVFRHFQIASNEIATPKVLICPADQFSKAGPDTRVYATSFTSFDNAHLSYCIGLDANQTNSGTILMGDRNITNGMAVKNGVLEVTANQPAGWTRDLHKGMGNIVFADGSARTVTNTTFRAAFANTGLPTNRLQMPVLTP